MGAEVVLPSTGEIVDLSELPTDEIAHQVDYFGEIGRSIASYKRAAADELARRLDIEGTRSEDVGDWHLETNAPTAKEWDVDRLLSVLDSFVEAGTISQRKADRCTRTKVEPVWVEVKKLLTDPRTAPEISLCFEEVPQTRTIKVTRR